MRKTQIPKTQPFEQTRTTLYVLDINNPRRVELRAAIASLDTLDR